MLKLFVMIVAGAVWAPFGWADGLNFRAQYLGSEVKFEYAWRKAGGAADGISFALPIEDVQRGSTEFGEFSQPELYQQTVKAMQGKAKELSVGGVEVEVTQGFGGQIKTSMRGPATALAPEKTKAIAAAMKVVQDEAMRDLLAARFYRRLDNDMIMPDHPKIVKRYAPALRPVEAAVRQRLPQADLRTTANWVMGWLQRIPYDRLTNRYMGGGGAGFQTPYGLFLNNRGDCDTKAVALLALLKGLYPDVPMAMIYAEDHAFVGIGIAQGPDDFALRLGGQVVVLADPTGPGLVPVGAVGPRTEAALRGGRYWHLWI